MEPGRRTNMDTCGRLVKLEGFARGKRPGRIALSYLPRFSRMLLAVVLAAAARLRSLGSSTGISSSFGVGERENLHNGETP